MADKKQQLPPALDDAAPPNIQDGLKDQPAHTTAEPMKPLLSPTNPPIK